MNVDISILIPSWNGASILKKCIESVDRSCKGLCYEIIVCDNGSTDDTPQILHSFSRQYDQLIWFRNEKNLYFARAINQLVVKSSGKSLLFLNNDVFLKKDCVITLAKALKYGNQIGAVAPQLLYPNGEIQPSCRRLPRFVSMMVDGLGIDHLLPKISWKMKDFDHVTTTFVEQPMMSAFLIKRECWEDVGPLDEQFPLYFNDVDWCYRAWKKGWKILFVPEAKAVHYEAWSGKKLGIKRTIQSSKGLYRYFRKHHVKSVFSPTYPVLLLLVSGLFLRGIGRHIWEKVKI